MSKFNLLISIVLIYLSCTTCGLSENKIRKQAIAIAEKYVSDQLKDAKKTITKNGFIIIGDKQKMFVIDPAKTYLGLIDDDSKTDAIVSLDCFTGQRQTTSEHLILINKDDKMIFNRAVESDMRIIEIKDRLITADVPTHSRNNPLFDCKSCREVIKYQFRKGELVKME
jgi:hypothetical protein